MKANRRIQRMAIVLTATAMSCCCRGPAPVDALSSAELVAEVESIQPGTPFAVGVLVSLENGWHTYWKDPGDSGMAPIFEWRLPDGLTAGPPLWPKPRRLETPPLVNYIYENRVLLMTEIIPAENLPAGRLITIRCDFSWLICKDICVAREAKLQLVLPVSAEAPVLSCEWHNLFERTREQM